MKKEEFLKKVQEVYENEHISNERKAPIDMSLSQRILYKKCMVQLEKMEKGYIRLMNKWGESYEDHVDFINASIMMDVYITQIQALSLFDVQLQDPNNPEIIVGLLDAKSKLLECHAKETTLF